MGFPYKRTGSFPTDAKKGGGAFDKFDNYNAQKDDQIWNHPGIAPQGMTASGGIINDYSDGGNTYRAHIFVDSGTFTVTANVIGNMPATCEYMAVGGGGGGGTNHGAGAGAGGFITNLAGHPKVASPKTLSGSATGGNGSGLYPITVGHGGGGPVGPPYTNNGHAPNGEPSKIVVSPTVTYTAYGGGAGGTNNGGNPSWVAAASGVPGGSGGGWKSHSSPGETFTVGEGDKQNTYEGSTTTASGWPVAQGNDGGAGYHPNPGYGCGGGGGAGGVGGDAPGTSPSSVGGMGGVGVQCLIAGPTASLGRPGPGGGLSWFGGGGAGGGDGAGALGGGVKGASPAGPFAGGGNSFAGPSPIPGTNPQMAPVPSRTDPMNMPHAGAPNTGGGGAGGSPDMTIGGNGGPGCVVIRYKINGPTQSNTAKATGGAISFTPTRAYHVFVNAGTFHYTDPNPVTINALVVGGGGSGGTTGGGNGAGGGAGGVIEGSLPGITGPYPVAIYVGAGGAGRTAANYGARGNSSVASFPSHPVIAYGGGAGDGGSDVNPMPTDVNGGSGGGGGGQGSGPGGVTADPSSTVPGSFTLYGNDGGDGQSSADGSGGGGGAGEEGHPGTPGGEGSTGGDGKNFPTWLPSTYGDGGYFGGGGGGQNSPGAGTGVAGGLGGGGTGYNFPTSPGPIPATNCGQDGTGGGGGGGGDTWVNKKGGAGVVIISYPI